MTIGTMRRRDYRALRRAAYPDVGDQLDAVLRGLRALIDGQPAPQDLRDLLEQVAAVKAAYPRPEGQQHG